MIPAHLDSKCAASHSPGCRGDCGEAVKMRADGRWFITMGHPGFNSTANNRSGYVNAVNARAAVKKYAAGR